MTLKLLTEHNITDMFISLPWPWTLYKRSWSTGDTTQLNTYHWLH